MRHLIIILILWLLCACSAQTLQSSSATQSLSSDSTKSLSQNPTLSTTLSPPQAIPQNTSLSSITAIDLQAAIVQAQKDNDTVSLQCWNTLQNHVNDLTLTPIPIQGIASAIQAKRSVSKRINAGLPPDIVSGCATLYVQEHFDVLRNLGVYLGLGK